MIIITWFIICICIAIFLGEIKYRFLDQRDTYKISKTLSKDWKEDIDTDLGKLFIECPNNDFFSFQALAMRGSWRLAQNQIMKRETFNVLREEEYAKKL